MNELNPWENLKQPPDSGAVEQLAYLKRMIEVFHQVGHPRLKALRRKLDQALIQLVHGAEAGESSDSLAKGFGEKVEALRVDVLEQLLTIVNQVRATVRVQRGGRPDNERLSEGLSAFSQGLRKLVSAAQHQDTKAEREAQEQLDRAAALLDNKGG